MTGSIDCLVFANPETLILAGTGASMITASVSTLIQITTFASPTQVFKILVDKLAYSPTPILDLATNTGNQIRRYNLTSTGISAIMYQVAVAGPITNFV